MQTIRWGLVGATVIGREWMVDAIRQAGGTINAVMSRDAERGRRYAAEFGIPRATTSLDDLFADVDAVYIATTNERHRDECIAAAAAGKHVLCEKPLATRLEDARAMVEACRKAGVVMATNHHLRNAATHRASRDAIAAGRIGRPLAARVLHGGALPEHLHGWRLKDPQAGAGVILDLTVHDSDLLRFILGDEPESIATFAQNGGLAAPGIEDAATHILKFRSGLIAQIYETFTTRYVRTSVEVHGSEGSVVAMDCMAQAPGGTVVLRTAQGEEALPLAQENYYARGVRLFHEAIAGKGAPPATGEDGVISLAVALAALRSAESGCAEAIEPGLKDRRGSAR
jgi:1,5-anhydro-D-fructose reductase (1,5-anhydro-D-mannitol-forming)